VTKVFRVDQSHSMI